MQRSSPKTFDEILPKSIQKASSKTSHQVNFNRQKTKKWVEAKLVNYDGEDWGYHDENKSYKPQVNQQDLQKLSPDLNHFTDLESSITGGSKFQVLANSSKKDDGKQQPPSLELKDLSSTSLIHKPSSFASQTSGVLIHGISSDYRLHSKAQSSSEKRKTVPCSGVSDETFNSTTGYLRSSSNTSTTESPPLTHRSPQIPIKRPPEYNASSQIFTLNQGSIPELESSPLSKNLAVRLDTNFVSGITEDIPSDVLYTGIDRKHSVTSLRPDFVTKSISSLESDSCFTGKSKEVPDQSAIASTYSAQFPNQKVDYDLSIMKDRESPKLGILSIPSTELTKAPNHNEQLQSEIFKKLSSKPSDEEKISQILATGAAKVGEKCLEDENSPAELDNFGDPDNLKNETTSITTTDNTTNSESSVIYIAPLSPRRRSQESLTPRLSDEVQILSESGIYGMQAFNSSPRGEKNILNEQPITSTNASITPEVPGEKFSERISEVSDKVVSTIISPLRFSQTIKNPLGSEPLVEVARLSSDQEGSEETSGQNIPLVNHKGLFASQDSAFSSSTRSPILAESSSRLSRADQLYPPAPSVNSPLVTSSSPVKLPTDIQSFREILALRLPHDRVRSFNEAREKYYTVEYGLNNWIRQVRSQNLEYEDITSHFPGPRSSVVSGYEQSRSKITKATGSPPFFQTSHHQNFSSNNSNSIPVISDLRQSTESSAPISHQITSVGNKTSSNQVQARGKDFFHTAGMIGGKAGKAGKGLLAKGKNRLRAAGGGDKEKENPATTRIKPERRASWSLPLIITRISGKRDSSLHETKEVDPTSIIFSHSVSTTWTSPAANKVPHIKGQSLSDRGLTVTDLPQKLVQQSEEAKNPTSKSHLAKLTAVNNSTYLSDSSEKPQNISDSVSGVADMKSNPSGPFKKYRQSIEPLQLKQTASTKDEINKIPPPKGILQSFKNPIKNHSRYPDKVVKSPRKNNFNLRYQPKNAMKFKPVTQASNDLVSKYKIQTKQQEVSAKPQRPYSCIYDKSLPSLPSLPLIPPLSLPSSIKLEDSPILNSEVQDVAIDHHKLRLHVPPKKGQARHSMIEGLSSQQAERNKKELLPSKRRNSNFDERQGQGHRHNRKGDHESHHALKAKLREKNSLTHHSGSKERDLNDFFFQQPHVINGMQPRTINTSQPIDSAAHKPKPLNVKTSIVSSSHSNRPHRGVDKVNCEIPPKSLNLLDVKSQKKWVISQPESGLSIPPDNSSKGHHSYQSHKFLEKKNYIRNTSSLFDPDICERPQKKPPSSAQRYRDFFKSEPNTVETELTDKKHADIDSLKYKLSSSQEPIFTSEGQPYKELTPDLVRPGSSDFTGKRKSTNKLLKEISGKIYAPSRNKRRHSSEFHNSGLNLAEIGDSPRIEPINSSVNPKVELKEDKNYRTSFFGGEIDTLTQNYGISNPIRRNNSVHNNRNSQTPGSSMPFMSKNSFGLHRKSSPAGYQHKLSDQADSKIRGEKLSMEVTKNLINTGTHIRRNTQPSFATQKSQDIISTAATNPNKKSSGSGLFNGFFGLLADKVDQQIDYSQKWRSRGTQEMSVSQQKKAPFDQSDTLSQPKEVVHTYPIQLESPHFPSTSPPDKQNTHSTRKEPNLPNQAIRPSYLTENKNSTVLITPYQSTISPVSSMSSLRASEIGTLITVSACSTAHQSRLSGIHATHVDRKYTGKCSSLDTIRPNNRLDMEVNAINSSLNSVENIQKESAEMIDSFREAVPMQSFLWTDQETICSSRGINNTNTSVNDNDFDESDSKKLDTAKVDQISKMNFNNIMKLNSHETGVMSATSYPGQEWNPYIAGA